MSLRAFHLLFILLSTLLALGFGAWGVRGYVAGEGALRLLLGSGSLVCAGGLVVYGVKVRDKLKDLGEP